MVKKKENDILKFKTSSEDEIKGKILELKKDLMKMRFQLVAGQLKNVAEIRVARRNIARLKTFLNAQKAVVKKK